MYTILYPELEPKLYTYQTTRRAPDPAQSPELMGARVPVTPAPARPHPARLAAAPAIAGGMRRRAPMGVTFHVPWLRRVWLAVTVLALHIRARWIRLA
jgi:hypothetical protein